MKLCRYKAGTGGEHGQKRAAKVRRRAPWEFRKALATMDNTAAYQRRMARLLKRREEDEAERVLAVSKA